MSDETEDHGFLREPTEDDEDCFDCDGDGWIEGDCGEDCCCCGDPDEEHSVIPCPTCNPKGVR